MNNNNYEEIKKILEMKEWQEERFKDLLTSNIWTSNYEEINKILSMEEWQEEKFKDLLTPNIWRTNYGEIKAKIRELQESGVDLSFLTQGVKPLKTEAIENAEAQIRELQEYGLPETATEELMETIGRHK